MTITIYQYDMTIYYDAYINRISNDALNKRTNQIRIRSWNRPVAALSGVLGGVPIGVSSGGLFKCESRIKIKESRIENRERTKNNEYWNQERPRTSSGISALM